MIPYSKPKLGNFYTLSQTKLLEDQTLHSGTYLYSLYVGGPPPLRLGVYNSLLIDHTCFQHQDA